MMQTVLLVVSTLLLLVTNGFADVRLYYEEGDIRLTDGPNPFQGRLEIYHEGEWGTVCSNVWNDYNAQVVCRQLGFIDGILFDNVVNNYPASSETSIFLSNIRCEGSELELVECARNDWEDTAECEHEQDVNVFCKVHNYLGCFNSQFPNYALTHKRVDLPDPLKLETCMDRCAKFEFMGLQGGDSCFCGYREDNYEMFGEEDASDCSTPCEGDSTQYCGGPSRMAVYKIKQRLLKCPKTIEFANGKLMEDQEFYYEGDTATVMCDDGFEMEMVCTEEGVWSSTSVCIEYDFGELPTDEHGDGGRNFEPILLMCVVIVILGIVFCM